MRHVSVTVIGKDRPGIIAAVTGAFFKRNCNLEDISMTVLEGEFAMMMIAGARSAGDRKRLEADMAVLGKKKDLAIVLRPVNRTLKRGQKHASGTVPYLVSIFGRDRTGIVYHMSDALARLKLNITDMNSRIMGKGKKAVYALMLEVDVPKRVSAAKLGNSIQRLARKLRVDAQIRPVERIEL